MPSGTRRRAALAVLCALLLTGLVVPATAGTAHAALPSGTSVFVPVPHVRAADTRAGSATGFVRVNSSTIRVGLGHRVPAGTTTVVLNVTALSSTGAGGVHVYPYGESVPLTQQIVLPRKGSTRTALVHVRLGSLASVAVKATTGASFLVDLVGAYTRVDPASTGVSSGRFVPLRGTLRALNAVGVARGGTVLADLSTVRVPATATAAVVTITSEGGNPGYWSAYADGGTRPTVDLWADTAGQVRSNQTIVPLNAAHRRVRLYSQGGGRVSLDVVGYYTGAADGVSTEGLFVPAPRGTPTRRLDTRIQGSLAPMGPTVVEFTPGTATVVQGVVGTVRVHDAWSAGTFVTRPAGVSRSSMPMARLTAPRDSSTTHFYSENSNRGVAITMSAGAHAQVDVAGWFIGTRPTATIAATPVNRIAATGAHRVRWSDAGGRHVLGIRVATANTTYATTLLANTGSAVAFKGMSTLGRAGNTMLFAHRTTYGAAFRNIHTMTVGSTFGIQGTNGKWHNYRVVARNVTSPYYTPINAIASGHPPVTAQLIACSKRDGTPTSQSYRIVVTGILVSVTNG